MGKQIKFISLLFLVGIFILFSLNFVSADKIAQISMGDILVEYPKIDTFKINETIELNFHAVNSSSGQRYYNDTVDCFFAAFGSNGSFVYPRVELNYSLETSAWRIILPEFTHQEVGDYYSKIYCNSSTAGGFVSYDYEITYTGDLIETSQAILYIPLFAMIIFTFVMILFFINKLPSANTRDEEGKILSVTYLKYLRSPLWFLEYMLFVAILYLSSNLAFAYLYETLFAQILFVLFRISFGLAPVIVIVWIIWIYAKMFQDRQFQDMINRGIFPQGKL